MVEQCTVALEGPAFQSNCALFESSSYKRWVIHPDVGLASGCCPYHHCSNSAIPNQVNRLAEHGNAQLP